MNRRLAQSGKRAYEEGLPVTGATAPFLGKEIMP